jgi:hypothetical protein
MSETHVLHGHMRMQCMSCHSPVAAAAAAVEEEAADALPTAAEADDAWSDMAWRDTLEHQRVWPRQWLSSFHCVCNIDPHACPVCASAL